jgi:tetratricopeptide (TPR) repeat protein
VRRTLVRLYGQRVAFFGRMSDLDRIVELGEAAVMGPPTAEALLTRAYARTAVHRFADAERDLDEAARLGAAGLEIEPARAAILLATGRHEEARALVEPLAAKHRTSDLIATLAVALGHLGRIDEAEARFVEAEAAYRGVSPIGLAQLYFDRGSMWHAAGDDGKARELLRVAVTRLPMYAHAAVHLAQLLPPAEGEALLRELKAEDPEVDATLAAFLELKEPGSGAALRDGARARYEALYSKHPLAFADHVAWFHLRANEPARALEAARKNLDNRPTAEAHELFLTAALAARKDDEACRVAERARALAWIPPSLETVVERASKRCGSQ